MWAQCGKYTHTHKHAHTSAHTHTSISTKEKLREARMCVAKDV